MRDDAGHWVAWSKIGGIGAARLRRLWEYFGDLAVAWQAGAPELVRAGLDARTVEAALAQRPRLQPEAEREHLERAGVDLVTVADAHYPALLRPLEGSPACLHVRGSLQPEDEIALAVVVLACVAWLGILDPAAP